MTDQPKIIEVGEVAENGLRLWCARTALDNAEKALNWQSTTINIFINRATALIGWNVTLSMAMLTIYAAYHLIAPLWVLPCFILSAICCGYILIPKSWEPPYTSIPYLLNPKYDTELEIIEEMAISADQSITKNYYRLKCYKITLVYALILIFAAPLIMAAIYLKLYIHH